MTTAVTVYEASKQVEAFGGGLEGAQFSSRETARWNPSLLNPDGVINLVKLTADARGRDTVQNDGYALGAVNVLRDSIVGAQYRLSAAPVWQIIPGASEAWADEFQQVAEAAFTLAAMSPDAWFDAAGVNDFTSQCRLAVASFCMSGEVTATAEWDKDPLRPFRTCALMFSPDRLSNPDGRADTYNLRRGVFKNDKGKPLQYAVRNGDQFALYPSPSNYTWTIVPAKTKWGRRQFIHIQEQLFPDQSRGIADMVSVLKQLRMTRQFQDIVLQNAVINASYAAAIESELPDSVLATALGAYAHGPVGAGLNDLYGLYMTGLNSYLEGAKNIAIDGAKVPHLYPGTKLNMKPIGTPGGVGAPFEASLLRHIAAGLGVSYEELSRDYSQVSYSSARTSAANTEKSTRAKKKIVADRWANEIYSLWLEEQWMAGRLPMPPGADKTLFYMPLMKEAFCRALWIGSGAGQIDELKETQAAILKVQSGLSTYEAEISKLGGDYREMFRQAIREQKMIREGKLEFLLTAKRPLGAQTPPQDAASEGS